MTDISAASKTRESLPGWEPTGPSLAAVASSSSPGPYPYASSGGSSPSPSGGQPPHLPSPYSSFSQPIPSSSSASGSTSSYNAQPQGEIINENAFSSFTTFLLIILSTHGMFINIDRSL